MAQSLLPSAVELRFVRATETSITLDFVLVSSQTPPVVRYELQWRDAGSDDLDEAGWQVASSNLKLGRATKSGLKPGVAYAFRARACAHPERWGPLGLPTAPIRTLLPELPETCSESLKVPSRVLAAQAEAAAERAQREAEARAAYEASVAADGERRRAAMAEVEDAERAADAHERLATDAVREALREAVGAAERALASAASEAAAACHATLKEAYAAEERAAVEEVVAHARDGILKEAEAAEAAMKSVRRGGPNSSLEAGGGAQAFHSTLAQMDATKEKVRAPLSPTPRHPPPPPHPATLSPPHAPSPSPPHTPPCT